MTAAAAPALYGSLSVGAGASSPSSTVIPHFPPNFSPVFDSTSDVLKNILTKSAFDSASEYPSQSTHFLPIINEPPSSPSQFRQSPIGSRIPILSPQPPSTQFEDDDSARFSSIPPLSRIPLPSTRTKQSKRLSPPPSPRSSQYQQWSPPKTLHEFNASFENGGSDNEGSDGAYDVLSDMLDCEEDEAERQAQWDDEEEVFSGEDEFGTPRLGSDRGSVDSHSEDEAFDSLTSPLGSYTTNPSPPTSPLLLPTSITPLPRLPPPKRSALRKRISMSRLPTASTSRKAVKWVEWVDVGVAHGAGDYDRTPIECEPLSKAGALEVVWMRLEMRKVNEELCREREEVERERGLRRGLVG
ncbi:hypothetical protein HDV00_003990 [Rhizophlyctis rosea]|nr:hypothetical protein HDV00_003990 [Rhizophlyctis rosea]